MTPLILVQKLQGNLLKFAQTSAIETRPMEVLDNEKIWRYIQLFEHNAGLWQMHGELMHMIPHPHVICCMVK